MSVLRVALGYSVLKEHMRCNESACMHVCEWLVHLSVVVEVPQVEVTHSVNAGKQCRMGGGPHDVVHIVRVVLEGVQRLIVLQK